MKNLETDKMVCGFCGKEINDEKNYGGKINGLLVDFVNKVTATIRLPLCNQCVLKIYYNINNQNAIKRNSDDDLDIGYYR